LTIPSIDRTLAPSMEDARWRARLLAWAPLLIVIAAGVHVGLATRGGAWFVTHEWIWYPVRLVEYVQAWKGGALYPRWCPDLYGGYGYPFFNYYAPGVYATAAALMVALGTAPTTALKLAVGGFSIAGGLGVFGLARGETRRRDAAVLAAIAYVYLPYRLVVLFVRGDLAEYAAFSLMPFALWGYRALLRADDARAPRVAVLAALAHAGVWFCHTITGLYTTEIIGLMLLVSAIARRRRRAELKRIVLAGAVLLLAIAMVSIYIVPAWFERSLVSLENVRTGIFHPSKNLVEWGWLFTEGFFSIGAAILVGLTATVLSFALKPVRREAAAIVRWWLPAIVIVSLTLTWAEPIWNVLPLGAFIQFPWRLLGFVGLFAAVGCAVTFATAIPERWNWLRWPACAVLVLSIAYVERGYNHAGDFVHEAKIPMTPEEIRTGMYTSVVANEYLPLTAVSPPTEPSTQSTAAIAGDPHLSTRRVNGLHYALEVDANVPSIVDVHVFDFPGWKVTAENGPAEVRRSTTPAGLIRLSFDKPGHYRLKIHFGLTALRACASALSLLAFAFGYWLLVRLQRRLVRT
jgi:hypothetical protein